MTPSAKLGIVAIGMVFAVGAWVALRPEPTDEDRIRSAIEAVAAGARAADVGAALDPLSEAYHDVEGEGHGKRDVAALLYYQFAHRGPISVALSPIEVQRSGDTAVATVDAALADFDASVVPTDADLWSLEIQLAREGSDWKITSYERK